ncbi:hypothetical protein HDU93_006997, partial [Gonapodya sp. JEL0774]
MELDEASGTTGQYDRKGKGKALNPDPEPTSPVITADDYEEDDLEEQALQANPRGSRSSSSARSRPLISGDKKRHASLAQSSNVAAPKKLKTMLAPLKTAPHNRPKTMLALVHNTTPRNTQSKKKKEKEAEVSTDDEMPIGQENLVPVKKSQKSKPVSRFSYDKPDIGSWRQ